MGDPEFGAHELVVAAEGEVIPGPQYPEQPPPDAGDDPDNWPGEDNTGLPF